MASTHGFGTNFLAGLTLGVALTALAPLAATDLVADSMPRADVQTKFEVQTVNRAAKSDRLHGPQRATRDVEESKPAKIPVGCDPAFSPLSKGAGMNFSSRCLALNAVGVAKTAAL
jgi:hypothetical protein